MLFFEFKPYFDKMVFFVCTRGYGLLLDAASGEARAVLISVDQLFCKWETLTSLAVKVCAMGRFSFKFYDWCVLAREKMSPLKKKLVQWFGHFASICFGRSGLEKDCCNPVVADPSRGSRLEKLRPKHCFRMDNKFLLPSCLPVSGKGLLLDAASGEVSGELHDYHFSASGLALVAWVVAVTAHGSGVVIVLSRLYDKLHAAGYHWGSCTSVFMFAIPHYGCLRLLGLWFCLQLDDSQDLLQRVTFFTKCQKNKFSMGMSCMDDRLRFYGLRERISYKEEAVFLFPAIRPNTFTSLGIDAIIGLLALNTAYLALASW
ncbi:hypothetical protein M8C21_023068 [Ambrosia artemisiifolia]|uniref:Uncharacterized protein n=1 Tax=Ambrosia artemisiifolia TaxID=4212 RepID=A0AAD5BV64_AMBAR|nr:hypothetical protein M8C21_023068 [Ambrosia artemisiifolia]